MVPKTKTLVLSATLALAACTHPADVSRPLTEVADKNAKFTLEDTPAGEAKVRGREIEPINEQTVRVSTGRNIVNARTSCRAFAEARWKS